MRLTLSTNGYVSELMDWIKQSDYMNYIKSFETVGDNCFVTLTKPMGFSENIVWLFETILLDKNQVTKMHESLRDVLSNIVFEPGKSEISQIVDNYITEYEHINLEGFVDFRLSEFAHKVDLVLYAAIKNSLLYT